MLYITDMPLYIYAGMSGIGLWIGFHFIAAHGLLTLNTSIVRCDGSEHALFLTQKNGLRVKVTPLSSSFVSPQLLLLAWKPSGIHSTRSRLTIITQENTSSVDDFRRLRVLLRFGKLNAPLTSNT